MISGTQAEPGPPRKSSARLRLRPVAEGRQSVNSDGGAEKGSSNRLAVLSVLATLVVAVLGSVTTMMIASTGAHNDRDRAIESFRRDNQQVAYAEFLTASTELSSAIAVGFHSIEAGSVTNEDFAKLSDKTSLVDTKYNVIVLVGSDTTRAAATALADAYNQAVSQLRNAVAQPAGVPRAADFLSQIRTLRNKFVESARNDLGAY